MLTNFLYAKEESRDSCAVLRESDEWGLRTLDLVHPPGRFWGDREGQDLILEGGVDQRRVKRVAWRDTNRMRRLRSRDSVRQQCRRRCGRSWGRKDGESVGRFDRPKTNPPLQPSSKI